MRPIERLLFPEKIHLLLFFALSSSLVALTPYQDVQREAIRVDASALAEKQQEPEKCALAWLEMVDQSYYQQSWIASSCALKQFVDPAGWERYLLAIRSPLGHVEYRRLEDQWNVGCSLMGTSRIALLFETKFSHLPSASELLLLDYVCDFCGTNRWRVAHYTNQCGFIPHRRKANHANSYDEPSVSVPRPSHQLKAPTSTKSHSSTPTKRPIIRKGKFGEENFLEPPLPEGPPLPWTIPRKAALR